MNSLKFCLPLVLVAFFATQTSQADFLNERWASVKRARGHYSNLNGGCINKMAPTDANLLRSFIKGCDTSHGLLRKNLNDAGSKATGQEKTNWNRALSVWSAKRANLVQRLASGNLVGTTQRRRPANAYNGTFSGQQGSAGYRN